MSDVQQRIDELVKGNPRRALHEGHGPVSACAAFPAAPSRSSRPAAPTTSKTVNVLEDEEVRQGIKDYANWPTIPQLYVNGEFVGGSDIMMEMYQAANCSRRSPRPEVTARRRAGRRHHRRQRRGLRRAAARSARARWASQTHLVVTPAGVLNAHHELGLDRARARGPGRPRPMRRATSAPAWPAAASTPRPWSWRRAR